MIRVFLAFDDSAFGQRLFECLNEQPDFQVCGKVELGDEAVREAVELQVANASRQHIPRVPLLPAAEEVSLEIAFSASAVECGISKTRNRGKGSS